MKNKSIILGLFIIFLVAGNAFAIPTLYVNGSSTNPLAGASEDLVFSFAGNQQTWTILSEVSRWRDVNYFGIYDDLGTGVSQTEVFSGVRDVGFSATTNFTAGQNLGMYLLNDINNTGTFDGDDSYLFSQRVLTAGSYANGHQWFSMYDVSSFGESDYYYNTTTEDQSYHGDFDYLIFIDDDHTAANWDHNDMVLGITSARSSIPEPGTLLLLGMGLAGVGTLLRKHKF